MSDNEPTDAESGSTDHTPADALDEPTAETGSAGPHEPTEERQSSATPQPPDNQSTADGALPGGRSVVRILLWGALAATSFIAIVALWQFYSHATAAIATVVASEYESMFLAGFNLVVLLLAGVAISLLVRELAGDGVSMSAQ